MYSINQNYKQLSVIKRAEKCELSSKQWGVCTNVCHMLNNNTILIRHLVEFDKLGLFMHKISVDSFIFL